MSLRRHKSKTCRRDRQPRHAGKSSKSKVNQLKNSLLLGAGGSGRWRTRERQGLIFVLGRISID
jgi:hypothetical protein